MLAEILNYSELTIATYNVMVKNKLNKNKVKYCQHNYATKKEMVGVIIKR